MTGTLSIDHAANYWFDSNVMNYWESLPTSSLKEYPFFRKAMIQCASEAVLEKDGTLLNSFNYQNILQQWDSQKWNDVGFTERATSALEESKRRLRSLRIEPFYDCYD